MNSKSIKFNYVLNTLYQMIVLLVPLLTAPYTSRVLGAQGIGTYSYTASIVSYFVMLASLGTTNYAQREIAFKRDDKEEVSKVFFEIIMIRCLMVGLTFIMYALFLCKIKQNKILFVIQFITIFTVATDVTWFFQGIEEFGKIIFWNIVVRVLNLIFIFSFIKKPDDLLLYVFGSVLLVFLGYLSMWSYLPHYIKKISINRLKPLRHLKGVFALFLPTVAIQIYTVMDKTMIGLATSASVENGYYEQAEKIVKMFLTLVTSLSTVMVPRIAFTYGRGEMNALKKYMYLSYRFVWFLAIPMFFGMITTAPLFIPWFLGDGFEKSVHLVCIFAGLLLAIGLSNITGIQYLIPTQKQNILTITLLIGAACNFFLNLYLIPKYYSVGAAVASVFAESVITIIQFIYVISIKREFCISGVFGGIWQYLTAGGMMYFVLKQIASRLSSNLFDCLILAGCGGIIYIMILALLKEHFVMSALQRIRKRSKK